MTPPLGSRRLLLFRHGKAQRGEAGERDFDRPLEPRGCRDAEKIGAFLARHGLVPDRVLVSPAPRAKDSWAHAALACPQAPAPIHDPRLYDGRAETILEVIRTLGGEARQLLVVGHNPGLHDLARMLVATGDVETRERLNENFPTAGLVAIGFAVDDWSKLHPQSGRLELFVEPRQLDAVVD